MNERKGNKGNPFLDQRTYIRELHLSTTFVRGLFGPTSTKEANNKPAENRDRRLKSTQIRLNIFHRISGTHEYFSSSLSLN